MSCRNCGNSSKWECVVCAGGWCSNCLYQYTKFRSSGLKCNGCVGISSRRSASSYSSDSGYSYSVSPLKNDKMEICSECREPKEKYSSCKRCPILSLK